jgi:hypothetical protein
VELAPIVLFVYNRLWHTRQTIEALQNNELALDSELFIYADGAKNKKAIDQVLEVRNYIKKVNGFSKVTIIERDKNWGLANSIIDGVTRIVGMYGQIIVLEDDLVTSQFFLRYMNEALEFYKDERRVMHISGWNYPMNFITNNDVYFYRIMDCWGWATWSDRWDKFEKKTDSLISSMTTEDIKKFNLNGSTNLWRQVKLNKSGRINTWAIYWHATIFKSEGLCLNPVVSYVKNIGNDGTGIHCTISDDQAEMELNSNRQPIFESKIIEDKAILIQIKSFFKYSKKSVFKRIFGRLHNIITKVKL